MDTTSLQTPRTGRSRFSKALPAPPPGVDDSLNITNIPSPSPSSGPFKIPRKLPSLPQLPSSTTAFPPRKSSVGTRLNLTKTNPPLPALPPQHKELPTAPKKMNAIPRKAVGQQPAAATTAVSELTPQGKEASSTPRKLKRVSSISSILSAYSSATNTSMDSVHRSSQGSVATKDSEASLSPERDTAPDSRAKFFETLGAYTGNPHEDELPNINDQVKNGTQQTRPPVPAKDTKRGGSPTLGLPANPRGGLPATPRSAKAMAGEATSSTATAPANSQFTLPLTAPATPRSSPPLTKTNDSETTSSTPYAPANLQNTPPSTTPTDLEATSSSPSGSANGSQTVWQRRAAKSDASITVPDLTLTVSHGSTGSTSLTSQSITGPPLPPKSATSNTTGTSPLPLKSSTGGLPGRNIRPAPRPPTAAPAHDELDEDEKMKKFAASVKAAADRVARTRKEPDTPKSTVPETHKEEAIKAPEEAVNKAPTPSDPDFVSPLSSPELRPSSQRGQGSSEPAGRPNSARNSGGRDQATQPNLPRDGQPMPRQRQDMFHSNEQQFKAYSPMGPILSTQRSNEQFEQQQQQIQAPAKEKIVLTVNDSLSGETSPTSTAPTGQSRRQLAPHGAPAPRTRPSLSMVGEEVSFSEPTPLSDDQQSQLTNAIMLFRRHDRPILDEYPVINAAPLRPSHMKCLGDHQGFIRTKNAVHSIACATCHVEDRDARFVCTTCSVRVCPRCRDLLEKHKDTGVVLDILQTMADRKEA
ncbi:hypothetical protein PG990_005794 [Apiospora arundinis]